MRKRIVECVGFAVLALVARVPSAPAAVLVPITLTAKAIAAADIRTRALRRLDHAPPITAYGRVLDPAPLVKLAAELAAGRSRVAAANARSGLARAQAGRAATLYRAQHNISQAALQSAQSRLQIALANQASAEAQLAALNAVVRADWGPTLATAVASAAAPLPQLERGADALVEVSLPLGQALASAPAMASATAPDGAKLALRLIGRAPRAAAGVAGQSLFYLMRTQNSAPIGTSLMVALEVAARRAGILVPRSAVVWHNGQALVYHETAPGAFAPTPILTSFGLNNGYFVPLDQTTALKPGDRVVVKGAALLFSAAQSPPATKPSATAADDH